MGKFDRSIEATLAAQDAEWEPASQPKTFGLSAPWNVCGVCDDDGTRCDRTLRNWPHRNNHFKKNHPDCDPKMDWS